MPLNAAKVHIDHSGTEIGIAISLRDSIRGRSGVKGREIGGLLFLLVEVGIVEDPRHDLRLPNDLGSRGCKMVTGVLHRTEMGEIEGLTMEEVKTYIRYITDRRLLQL